MMRLSNLLLANARPPPPTEIAQAFKDFFGFFQGRKIVVEEIQSSMAITSFKYLQEKGQELKGFGLSLKDLQDALKALNFIREKPENKHRKELTELIVDEVKHRTSNFKVESTTADVVSKVLHMYLHILSRCGEVLAARELLLQYQERIGTEKRYINWGFILQGFARENNEEEIQRTLDLMQEHGFTRNGTNHAYITMFYISLGDIEAAKRWYKHPVWDQDDLNINTKISMLRMCLFHRDFEWGQPIVEEILRNRPNKKAWDVVFQWPAAKGKGVDEIARMK